MSRRCGLVTSKAANLCMAGDCQRKALYRNPTNRNPRGYCAEHRTWAIPADQHTSQESYSDYYSWHGPASSPSLVN